MNNLEDFIANLTPEERQKHQSLIQECLKRKEMINKNTEKAINSIDSLNKSIERLKQGIKNLENASRIQCEITNNLLTDILPLIQKLSPGKPSMN